MKELKFLFCGATALLLASCSNELMNEPQKGESTHLSFTVNSPKDFSSRAVGDGTTASSLNVLVYDVTGASPSFIFANEVTMTGTSTTVDLDLVNGKSYEIVFFAQSENSETVYTIDQSTGMLSVNYENMTSADNIEDAYDCFYASYSTGLVSGGALSESVTLIRPVAQVNWGNSQSSNPTGSNYSDVFGTNGAYIQTTFTAQGVPDSMNLLTGEVSTTSTTDVTFTNFASPSVNDEAFPGNSTGTTYSYVAMQYLLAGNSSSLYDLTLVINNQGGGNSGGTFSTTIQVPNVPVQANYQTNIYGAMLTSSASVSIAKSEWAGTYNKSFAWDGNTTYPTVDEDSKTVDIDQPSDLAGLADMVNGENGQEQNSFDGFTIVLGSDFDMNNKEFPMIGSATRSGTTVTGNVFRGIFDGQGHTIKNLKITGTGANDEPVGFFAHVDGASSVVKNVTFSNISVSSDVSEQVGIVGILTGGATVSNVKVTSGSFSGKEGVGAIVGRMMLNGTVTECINYAPVTSASTNAGGIIGAAYYTSEGSSMVVSNCTNYGTVTGASQAVGGIVGLCSADVSGCTNSGKVINTDSATGGIVGQQVSAGSITGCTNNSDVTGGSNASNYGAGGIVGWVRYQNSGYTRQNVITVKNCKNSANVSGPTSVGGIVGSWYMCGVCDNNTNTAPTLKSSNQFVAGIVGGQQWSGEAPSYITTGDTNMLYVNYNFSSTPLSDMTGGASSLFVYVNSPSNVDASNNSNDNQDIVNQGN